LKESGVVVGQSYNDYSVVDSSSANSNVNSEITKRMDRNYRQRERQMKLSRIDLYLKMNNIAKANELMKEVEEEMTQEAQEEDCSNPMALTPQEQVGHVSSSHVEQQGRNQRMPPLNEIVVGEDVVESQLTTTQV